MPAKAPRCGSGLLGLIPRHHVELAPLLTPLCDDQFITPSAEWPRPGTSIGDGAGTDDGVPPLGQTQSAAVLAHDGKPGPGPEGLGRVGDEVVDDDGVVVGETDQVTTLQPPRTPTPNADTLCDVGSPVRPLLRTLVTPRPVCARRGP
jgi:hypothetical protein